MNKYLKIAAVPLFTAVGYVTNTFAAPIGVNNLENKITLLGSGSDNIGQSFLDLVYGKAASGDIPATPGIFGIVIDVLPYFLPVAALIVAAPRIKGALMTVFNKVMTMVGKRSA